MSIRARRPTSSKRAAASRCTRYNGEPLGARRVPISRGDVPAMRRGRRYVPGSTPDGAGVFLRFDLPAGGLRAALERLGAAAEAYERRRRRALVLVPLLLAAACVALLIDLLAGDGARVYAWFAPVLAAAVPLVAWATVPEPGRLRAVFGPLRDPLVALAVMVAFPAAFAGLVVAIEGGGWPRWTSITVLLLVTTLLPLLLALTRRRRHVLALFAGAAQVWHDPPSWRAPLAALGPLADGLAKLAAAGTRVTGFVDLAGAERAWKELRLPPRPDLPQRRLYRDEWAHVELVLPSGARLRLRAAQTLSRRVTAAPFPGGDRPRSVHTLVACLWRAPVSPRPDDHREPASPRPEATVPVLRLERGRARHLVELQLDARTLGLDALGAALRQLELNWPLPAGDGVQR